MRSGFYLEHPADGWETGIPVGNGRQGAVLFGGTETEQILLNEESLWYGGQRKRTVDAGPEKLSEIRSLLENGEVLKAQQLCGRWFTGYPRYTNPYHPAAEVKIEFSPKERKHKTENPAHSPKAYRRGLDLEEGKAFVEFGQGGSLHRRELFSSVRYQVSVLRIETGGAEQAFALDLHRRPFEEEGDWKEGAVYLKGQSGDGVFYCVGCAAGDTDGRVKTEGGYLIVEGGTYAELFFCVRTDYESGNPAADCERLLLEAKSAGYKRMEQAHRKDYKALYGSMEVKINGSGEKDREDLERCPADELLRRAEEPEVRAYLTELMFAYARYLLISSSYSCALPANLQGIWNGSFTPPWESAYTININLQMNYWMADGAGLGACFRPLEDLIWRMLPKGKETARRVYGCEGFVAHHNTNLWGDTDITGRWIPAALWPVGGAWLANQLYDHGKYEENPDEMRNRILPVLGECVRFFYGYLCRKPDGSWVSGPSVSPENTCRFFDGQETSVVMGPVMDHQIIRELSENCLEGCRIYGGPGTADEKECEALRQMAEEILSHLPHTRTGSDGRILEWQEEYAEVEKGHRHISHLYGLYPGREISEDTPELWKGAKKTLEYRLKHGGGHTGWSRAWIQCFYAKLKEAEKLDEQLRLFFSCSVAENLWDRHPPFQIDGNFGMAAAVLQALAERRGDTVEILRAVPQSWKTGNVRGQRLMGRLCLDYSWENGRLKSLYVHSGKRQRICLEYPGGAKILELEPDSGTEILSF